MPPRRLFLLRSVAILFLLGVALAALYLNS